MDKGIPKNIEGLVVGDATRPEEAMGKCDILFSSYEGNKDEIKAAEMTYAKLGFPVISNNSAHRWTDDVPMIIPEINYNHARLIDVQKKTEILAKFLLLQNQIVLFKVIWLLLKLYEEKGIK